MIQQRLNTNGSDEREDLICQWRIQDPPWVLSLSLMNGLSILIVLKIPTVPKSVKLKKI